jgi:hypothetical protein
MTITADRTDGVIPLWSIIKICALAFGVQEEDIPGKSRTQQNSFARHAYCHLAKMIGYKLEQIGRETGRSHCTVLASVKASENLIASKYGCYVRPFEAAKKMVEEYGRTAAPESPQDLNVNNPGQAAGAARYNE